jgi:hypothetical protein
MIEGGNQAPDLLEAELDPDLFQREQAGARIRR